MAGIRVFNILTTFGILMVSLPTQLDAFYASNTGCHHNGTWYADKSLVPTTEKCLNCQCSKKTLVCRLKVCPEMPMPPPRGCVVVQKKNTCCPYLSCARLDAFYKIPATRRIIAYLDHYERESIDRVVNENMLQRRSDDTEVDLYVCVKNGTVYKSGSAMSSSNLCSYCYCIGGTEKCVKPKCMLPVEGCKPIFVDSTCCPVRYDCSSKQTGKSSQEVRYRKTSNKHYMRMSQRLQRNHGCTVGQQFYTEGQKMKSDKNKPCDICFCIRGQRKCAPKKCAPALRNCIPVVPKGQCCPSSYDCGSQRDYRRSQNSRQFNLFSLLFGKDEEQDENTGTEIAVQYPHDREPVDLKPAKYKPATTEKSLYDTIREGLEFIDNNNNQMLKDNTDLVGSAVKQARPSPTPIPLGLHNLASTTEISFLDLLLGSSEANGLKTIETSSEESDAIDVKTTPANKGAYWVDFLLGPEEEGLKSSASSISYKTANTDSTITQDRTDLESTTFKAQNFLAANSVNMDKIENQVLENLITSTMDATATTEPVTNEETTQTLYPTLAETEQMTSKLATKTEPFQTTEKAMTTSTTIFTTTTKKPTTTVVHPTTRKTIKATTPTPTVKPFPTKIKNTTHTHTHTKPEKKPDFLAQLLDGLSDILGRENKTRLQAPTPAALQIKLNKTTTNLRLPPGKPLPLFKPLPQDKTYTRINSKIANLTVSPALISNKEIVQPTFKPLPTKDKFHTVTDKPAALKQISTTPITVQTSLKDKVSAIATPTITIPTLTTAATIPTKAALLSSSTSKPLVIKTNPTILESEPLDQNAEPTLPPSLPNLKIIPFLPTDAVQADHNQGSTYEFYHHASAPISRIDYDLYDDANLYPSITEKYPLYADLEDGSKAEYIYKFNVEGPDAVLSSNAGKFDGTLGSPAFLKYDFASATAATSSKGFSPPTKTEGGFVPKEPLMLDDDDDNNHHNVSIKLSDNYHVTQHVIDITTAADISNNTTKVIEITTPDPFRDVIRTEPPPDLTSLIEDKLKNLISKSNTTKSTTLTASNQIKKKPQNTTEIEMNLKQTDQNSMSLKTTTQIKMTATHIGNQNANNRTQVEAGNNDAAPDKITEILGDDMTHGTNADVNDVSTIPPFKSLPMAQQLLKDYTSTAIKEPTKSETNNKLKQTDTDTNTNTGTTIRPMGSATTMPTINNATITEAKRPAAATAIKVNRNKTIAIATKTTTTTITRTTTPKDIQQKPTKINKNSTLHGSETKILASTTKATATKTTTTTSSSSSSPSSPSSPSSAGTVSTYKTKPNTTRRVTNSKPIKHHKPTTNSMLPTATIKSTPNTNAINIDRTSVAIRRTQKPTTSNANPLQQQPVVTQPKTTSAAATKKTTTTTTDRTRTTTALPSTTSTASTIATSTSPALSSPSSSSSSSSSLQRVSGNTNPFLMSPFDKLPFMDASFEVKRISATPPTTTATTASYSQQRFAVAATIATDALLDGANDGPSDSHDDVDDSFTSSRHKLMGLVHYKHTLNQLEGLEPSTRHRPQQQQHSAYYGSRVSSPTSTVSQHQHQPQSSSSINNLIDPTGILKLAGCNIYGRMYRVGRIILELSSPCLECKCTEIGVKCGPLDC